VAVKVERVMQRVDLDPNPGEKTKSPPLDEVKSFVIDRTAGTGNREVQTSPHRLVGRIARSRRPSREGYR